MNSDYKKALGGVLASKRRAAGVSKQELSRMVGANRLTIRLIESGQANPTVDMLLRITRGLGVSLADVIVESERNIIAADEKRAPIPRPIQSAVNDSTAFYYLTGL